MSLKYEPSSEQVGFCSCGVFSLGQRGVVGFVGEGGESAFSTFKTLTVRFKTGVKHKQLLRERGGRAMSCGVFSPHTLKPGWLLLVRGVLARHFLRGHHIVGAHSAWALGVGHLLVLHQGGLVGDQGAILPHQATCRVFLINVFGGNREKFTPLQAQNPSYNSPKEANSNLDSGPGGPTRSTPRGGGRRSRFNPSTP